MIRLHFCVHICFWRKWDGRSRSEKHSDSHITLHHSFQENTQIFQTRNVLRCVGNVFIYRFKNPKCSVETARLSYTVPLWRTVMLITKLASQITGRSYEPRRHSSARRCLGGGKRGGERNDCSQRCGSALHQYSQNLWATDHHSKYQDLVFMYYCILYCDLKHTEQSNIYFEKVWAGKLMQKLIQTCVFVVMLTHSQKNCFILISLRHKSQPTGISLPLPPTEH